MEEAPVLGRMTGNLKIGIVGMPNVGKSSLFNTLSKLNVPAENYPFCTIDPNVARVIVPDERFNWLCNFYKPKSEVAATLQITDIAGLVKGAAEGAGLGNAFLSHIMAVDGIFHVIRAFEDKDIVHVEGEIDPIRDLDIIENELLLKDKEKVDKEVLNMEKVVMRIDKTKKADLETLQKAQQMINEKKNIRHGKWTPAEAEVLNQYLFISAKPVIYLVNLSEADYQRKKNSWLPKIKKWVDEHNPGDLIIPFSVELEAKLVAMDSDDDRKKYCEEKQISSNLQKIITHGYHHLRLIHFITAGEDEVRCWTIPYGTKAPQAAGAIHTDFEKGFICAEVMAFEDFKEHGSESAVKAVGKYKQQGKTYTVQDGDIIFFKFNAGAGLKGGKK